MPSAAILSTTGLIEGALKARPSKWDGQLIYTPPKPKCDCDRVRSTYRASSSDEGYDIGLGTLVLGGLLFGGD